VKFASWQLGAAGLAAICPVAPRRLSTTRVAKPAGERREKVMLY